MTGAGAGTFALAGAGAEAGIDGDLNSLTGAGGAAVAVAVVGACQNPCSISNASSSALLIFDAAKTFFNRKNSSFSISSNSLVM